MPDQLSDKDHPVAQHRPAAVRQLVEEVLRGAGLACDAVGEMRRMTLLQGEHKRTIGVLFEVGDTSLMVTSMFAGRLDEGQGEVYGLLLTRNQKSRYVHFALDDDGQLVLTGRVPLAAVDHTLLGEVLGEVLTMADSAFNQVLRTGFASYLAHEQAWRAGAGMPPNPVGEPN